MSIPGGAEKLNEYLRAARAQAGAGTGKTVCCVVGNEAADLDSMASAVVYAYCRGGVESGTDSVVVPLINIPRGDFKLRTEAAFLFREAGVELDALLFADEFDPRPFHESGALELILVDHNRPAAAHGAFHDAVRGVIDHHSDEGLFADAAVRVVEPTGSAATLVAREILESAPDRLTDGPALLLLGTILLDTVNLDPEAKRVTPEDRRIAEELLTRTGADQQQLFDALQREKFNVSALDSADLLRKDYKEWTMGDTRLGISSVLLPVEEWLKKDEDLPGSLAAFARSRNLDILIAMNAFTNPGFSRQLVVFCADPGLRSRVIAFLKGSDLGLREISSDSVDDTTALYDQDNVAISRKKLQPLLASFFEEGT